MNEKIPVAVLGATGTVGQRFVSLLADHPWFEIVSVTGSERSEGKAYGEAARWLLPGEIPLMVREMHVKPSDGSLQGARLLFSALPARVAEGVEPRLAAEGYIVCSNASTHRMGTDIPLLIPEINADHLALIDRQRDLRGWSGLIVTSPNCSTTGIVFPLKALDDAFGVSQVHAVTMQAISGAGYPGVSSMEQYDNVIPYIRGEEVKMEQETRKLLGELGEEAIEPADIEVSAQANRVPVLDGHLAALSIGLRNAPNLNEVEAALAAFRGVDGLPSAPAHPLIVRSEENRPQPRLDRDAQDGMAVSVGRVQPCSVLDFRMVSLVHNTLRGAAGGALLNAELLVIEGYLGEAAREVAFA
ncbi:MAG: aspartate-semialdehyde dehydrogenase [Chloroflexi bacterium]|nr:aspartate-semialdehyde dehydrogenase [Chloroflexota bacterium]